MDNLVEKLENITLELVTDHGMDHADIKRIVFKVCSNVSEALPKLRVLYNDTYGGYGYSKDYKEFRAKHLEAVGKNESTYRGLYEERIKDVDCVEAFGKHCKDKYPLIAQMIATYKHHDMATLDFRIKDIVYRRKCMDTIHNALQTTTATPEDQFGDETNVGYVFYGTFDFEKAHKYSKESLILWLVEEKNKITKSLEESTSYVFNKVGDKTEWLIENYTVVFDEEDTDDVLWYKKKKWDEKMTPNNGMVKLSFVDAIKEYGESHFAIWKCQGHFRQDVMRFLLKHPDVIPLVDSELCKDIDIGLVFASGEYCKLQVGEAPQLLDWWIGEYDGKEGISIS